MIEEECSGCKTCIPLCPYSAITFDAEKKKAAGQRGAVQGLRHLRGRLPVRLDRSSTCSRTTQIFEEIEGVLDYV